MTAYYNEFDKGKAAWLRELIKAGLIAPGDVDERSIADVQPADLVGYTQCHFFAGIGIWSYALRLAGWPDDRPVWTGSCPCRPFSVAGKRKAFTDERHLWPEWWRLIRECRPPVIFGEQVAATIGMGWLDTVADGFTEDGYEFFPAVISASAVGAPHIRERLYFVAALPEMRAVSTCGVVLQGSERLQLLPAQDAENTKAPECAERATVRSDVSAEVSLANAADACQKESRKIQPGLRSGRSYRRNENSNHGDALRDDGGWADTGIRLRQPGEAVLEHGVSGPQGFAVGVHTAERENSVLGDECGHGYMGRERPARSTDGVGDEQGNIDARQPISPSVSHADKGRESADCEIAGATLDIFSPCSGSDPVSCRADDTPSDGQDEGPAHPTGLFFCADAEYSERWTKQQEHSRTYGRNGFGGCGEFGDGGNPEGDGREQGRPESAGQQGRPNAAEYSLLGDGSNPIGPRLESMEMMLTKIFKDAAAAIPDGTMLLGGDDVRT